MMPNDQNELTLHFRQSLDECRRLYVEGGRLVASEHPQLLAEPESRFIERMDDLHRALLVKIFVTLCESDRRWSRGEQHLAGQLLLHLWGQRLEGEALHTAIGAMSKQALALKWYSCVRPFDRIAPLRNRVGDLETLVVRIANLVARVDGPMKPVERAAVDRIVEELGLHLRAIPIDEPSEHAAAADLGHQASKEMLREADHLPATRQTQIQSPPQETATQKSAVAVEVQQPPASKDEPSQEEKLAEAMAELDQLIGLAQVKQEIRTLANFLKVQHQREQANLPTTPLSLHMVFGGNPGTGKTTVARIVGKIFGAMGVLEKGHLIETDRSGLVAEYAGQTGPKTNKKIDEALDGVLFIDEAYTLIAATGDDPFGHEAVQTLLKRMEDDRERLVIILAGYPDEMEVLLRSNPGLSSRFSRKLEFVDYQPIELAKIFGWMCQRNRYELCPDTRAKVMLGFDLLYTHRDKHFGNGRTVRNLFEHSIRRMANRIAGIAELSIDQLTSLAADDVEFRSASAEEREKLRSRADEDACRFHITCPNCAFDKNISKRFLGQHVRCPKCKHKFQIEWGEVVAG